VPYAELHCHSYYSFHDGASSLEELLCAPKNWVYQALSGGTDHNNLCGAPCVLPKLTASLEIKGIIGAELTLTGGYHLLTLLAKTAPVRVNSAPMMPFISSESGQFGKTHGAAQVIMVCQRQRPDNPVLWRAAAAPPAKKRRHERSNSCGSAVQRKALFSPNNLEFSYFNSGR